MNRQLAMFPHGEILSPSPPVDLPDEGKLDIDFRLMWSAIYRNRYLVIAIFGLCIAAGLILTILSTKIYTSAASVQIDQQTSKVLGSEDDPQGTAYGAEADRFLQTQIDVIRSRAIAERVAESLNLYGRDDVVRKLGGKPLQTAPIYMSLAQAQREQVIALLMRNMQINLPKNSRIVTLYFSSADPYFATSVVNSYANNYIISNLQRRFDSSAYARDFLEKQLSLAKARLERAERDTVAYAKQAGLLDTSAGVASSEAGTTISGPRSLTTSDLVQSNTALVAARGARVQTQQRWEQAARTPLLSLPEVQGNDAIQQLVQQRAAAQAAYEQDLQRRKPDFPSMKQQAAQIKALDEQINGIASHIRDGIRDQYMVALHQEQSMASSVDRLKGATLAEQDRSIRYNILRREADTSRSMYEALLQRYKEISAQAGVTSNNVTLLDQADVPTRPTSPRPLVNLAVAILCGAALAGIAVFVRERFDDAVRSPEDMATKYSVPYLNSVPRLPLNMTPQDALADPRSAFSEAYSSLRASIRLASPEGVPTTLLFTSGREAEGKSTTALAIARGFAEIGQRVLLIDGDLRKPSLHRVFGVRSDAGFSNVLARLAPLETMIQETPQPNLSFLPAGSLPPSPAALLSGPCLSETIARCRALYDLVIVDGPPVLGLADAILYANVIEGTIYVVEAGRNSHGAGKMGLRRLLDSGARVIGTVLTKFDPRHDGYGEDYNNYYTYGTPKLVHSRARRRA